MSILVIAEHDNIVLKPATLNTITAAASLGDDIHLLVAGSQARPVAEAAAKIKAVTKVWLADDALYADGLAEPLSLLVAKLGAAYQAILTPATSTGKNLLPRVAALLDVAQISDVCAIVSGDTFVRPIYAGNALATVQSKDAIKVITVRATAFAAAAADGGQAPIEALAAAGDLGRSTFLERQIVASDRPDLTAAKAVIAGGRGMGSQENFKLLEVLADKLGGAVGATRAAVDAGYVPNDLQIGQTGKIVAPELYIAVAISGAIQHLAGMKDSKVIVAINKDAEAPIFQVADYGLVADLFQALPELTTELNK